MQLSGMHDGGRTCHRTSLLMITLKSEGIGSAATFLKMPGGFPSLSCNGEVQPVKSIEGGGCKRKLMIWKTDNHGIVVATAKLDGHSSFTPHPLLWSRIRPVCIRALAEVSIFNSIGGQKNITRLGSKVWLRN